MSCNEGPVDLHIHSNKSSDGDFSPFHLIKLAKEKKLRAISISDHDTLAAYPEAIHWAQKIGVEIIPSIELTTAFRGREFHLLLPFVNWRKPVIKKIITEVVKRRFEEAKQRVIKLQQLNFDIRWKEVIKKSEPFPPLGVTIAQILLDKADRINDNRLRKYLNGENKIFAPYLFYKDYFMDDKPAFVPKKNVSLLTVLEKVPLTEGVPVLAHPGAHFQRTTKEDLSLLKEQGLVGLEVFTSYHDAAQTEFYKKIAKELDLVPVAGSDFHGRIKPHIPFGSIKDGKYWMVEELKRRRG